MGLERFKVGNYLVDVKRNQLTSSEQTISIEPKVMDVLHYLALNQGKVVSQQELFEALWPNSLFSSGSILRCIAQLRKALGDDAKKQAVIHTHPKRGYSLQLSVEALTSSSEKVHEKLLGQKSVIHFSSSNHIVYKKPAVLVLFLMLIVVSIGLIIKWPTSDNSPAMKNKFSQLTPLTSTKADEFKPKFSPIENSIAFIRKDEFSNTHLWVKNLETKQEYQLGKSSKELLSFSWSHDGRDIAYLSKTNTGYELGYISIPISKMQLSTAQVLYQFKSDEYVGAIQWGKKNQLYYLLYPKEDLVVTKAKVYSFDMKTKTSKLFWQQEGDFSPYDMSLSPDHNSLAFSGYENNFMTSIKVLSLKGQALKDRTLLPVINQLPMYTEVSWHPSGQHLLLTDAREVKLLDLHGELNKIDWLNFHEIENSIFDADGERIAVTLSKIDIDIVLKFTNEELTNENNAMLSISNSNSIDTNARFSPNGSAIVYISDQEGYQQVFRYQLGVKQLFFSNPTKEIIGSPPLWSLDGKRVLIHTTSQLVLVDADTLERTYLPNPVNFSYVYDWYLNDNALLVDYRNDDGLTIAKYDFNSNKLIPLVSGNIHYAHLVESNSLIVIKDQAIVKVTDNKETILFKPAVNQKVVASVSVDNGVLFQLNSSLEGETPKKELWKISSFDSKLTYIEQVPNFLDKIIDVNPDGGMRLFITPAQQEKSIVLLQ